MLILVDSNYLCHYCAFSSRGFSHNGNPTGVIFSFLRQVLGLAKRFKTHRFAFAWDSRKSVRRISYQRYKQNRVEKQKTEEERELEATERQQFQELRLRVLPKLGFRNQLFQVGYEADDIIASVVHTVNSRIDREADYEEIVIVAADNDMYQLLQNKVSMWRPREKALYTLWDFREEWGVLPYQWSTVKSIAGCSGDNVEGVAGVGEKTAIQYLKGELRGDSKKAISIRDSKEVIDRNFALVHLPLAGTKTFGLAEDVFYLNDFYDVVAEYGLKSFRDPDSVGAWRECFGMRGR